MISPSVIICVDNRGLPLAAAMDILRRCQRCETRVLLRLSTDQNGALSGQFYAQCSGSN
jgi:hypothetical protein